LEDIGDQDEQVGGQSVTLPEAVSAPDPGSRDSVEEDGGVARTKDVIDPCTPKVVEPVGTKDHREAAPVYGVESFPKVYF
jgi:hypothetical protein